jgi:peptidoglycan-N-acetylmuramic acid deacetylase
MRYHSAIAAVIFAAVIAAACSGAPAARDHQALPPTGETVNRQPDKPQQSQEEPAKPPEQRPEQTAAEPGKENAPTEGAEKAANPGQKETAPVNPQQNEQAGSGTAVTDASYSPGQSVSSAQPPAGSAKPAAQNGEGGQAPTKEELKAVSWYYMKKKKGEVPGFPAEVKKFTESHKAVWVGTGKKVYLTIDVGGALLDYEKLLKALKDNDVKATFFVTGYNLKNNPDYIKLLLEEGHTVGNHTITHKDFTTLTDAEIKKEIADFEKLYKEITGEEPVKYFRFPYGKYSLHTLKLISDLGYTSYFWSTAMKDWEPRKNGADDAYNDIIGNLHDGNIILMHQASKENIEAMDRILKRIKEEGYEFGTLDELQK